MEKIGDNVVHGDTGPVLFKSMIEEQHQEYSDCITDTNFIAAINFFDYEDYLKPTSDIVPQLKLDEIWGFHIWNAMFTFYGVDLQEVNNGFYFDIKKAISTSSTKDEYKHKIHKIMDSSMWFKTFNSTDQKSI
jgi:hypothetical protein